MDGTAEGHVAGLVPAELLLRIKGLKLFIARTTSFYGDGARRRHGQLHVCAAVSLSPERYAQSRSRRPGSVSAAWPLTHTPCTPRASVLSRAWPPGRSLTRCFG